MVYRIFVEKKEGLDNEAKGLLNEAKNLLGIEGLENIRLFNRYDVEDIDKDLFQSAVQNVFSEPQLDITSDTLSTDGAVVFAVEPLPGQYDQRADSASTPSRAQRANQYSNNRARQSHLGVAPSQLRP